MWGLPVRSHFPCILPFPPVNPALDTPPTPVADVASPAPWLCASNERSRHALSGLRPWKAVRHSEVKKGETALVWRHTPLGWTPQRPRQGFFRNAPGVMEREWGDRGMNKRNSHWRPNFYCLAVHWGFSGLPIFGKPPQHYCSGMELWRKELEKPR